MACADARGPFDAAPSHASAQPDLRSAPPITPRNPSIVRQWPTAGGSRPYLAFAIDGGPSALLFRRRACRPVP
jgi:hypothetical protein